MCLISIFLILLSNLPIIICIDPPPMSMAAISLSGNVLLTALKNNSASRCWSITSSWCFGKYFLISWWTISIFSAFLRASVPIIDISSILFSCRWLAISRKATFNVPNGVPSKTGVGYAQTPNDLGYYILTSDGRIYTFGNAQFYGSVYNIPNAPVKTSVAIATTPDGGGYYVLTADGGVYTFGDANFLGSIAGIATPIAIQ